MSMLVLYVLLYMLIVMECLLYKIIVIKVKHAIVTIISVSSPSHVVTIDSTVEWLMLTKL